jgi:hypothetical protein
MLRRLFALISGKESLASGRICGRNLPKLTQERDRRNESSQDHEGHPKTSTEPKKDLFYVLYPQKCDT